MSFASLVVAVSLALGVPDPSPQTQGQAGISLPDIEVSGRPTEQAVRQFVERIAAPARRRGLARWEGRVCPGIVNLEPVAAQAIADRIALAARDVGVDVGGPGCRANIVVVFSDGGSGLADAMVSQRRRLFDQGIGALGPDDAALEAFRTDERAVRWWPLSMPVDTETGRRAIRIPGEAAGGPISTDLARILGCSPIDCSVASVPIVHSTGASHLNTQIADSLYKVIIIVDVDDIGAVNTTQLGDYLALVSLAQIDPEADTAPFDTVLNLFSGANPSGLTDWDRSYLQALYANRPQRRNVTAAADSVVSIMIRDRVAEAQRD